MEYEVRWTLEKWYKVSIEADSPEQAEKKFHEGDYENEQMYGAEVQDSVEVFEIVRQS
jgi:hypothetical protein